MPLDLDRFGQDFLRRELSSDQSVRRRQAGDHRRRRGAEAGGDRDRVDAAQVHTARIEPCRPEHTPSGADDQVVLSARQPILPFTLDFDLQALPLER